MSVCPEAVEKNDQNTPRARSTSCEAKGEMRSWFARCPVLSVREWTHGLPGGWIQTAGTSAIAGSPAQLHAQESTNTALRDLLCDAWSGKHLQAMFDFFDISDLISDSDQLMYMSLLILCTTRHGAPLLAISKESDSWQLEDISTRFFQTLATRKK